MLTLAEKCGVAW